MHQSPELKSYLETIMNINVMRVGGASAGILGSSGADNDILNNLKKKLNRFRY